MSPSVIGLVFGASLGLLNFMVLRSLANKVEGQGTEAAGRVRMLRLVAALDLLVFPILGWFLGPMVLS